MIKVSICEYGIVHLSYIWPNIIAVDKTEDRTMLTADQAIQKYLETQSFKVAFKHYQNQTFPEIYFRQVYVYQGNHSVSTWMFGESEVLETPVIIDAYTGEELEW